MYQFITGPLVWISFLIFFIGLIVRGVLYIKGLNWQKDRVAYSEHMSYGIKGALRSIFFWLIPFGTKSWREKPLFTIMFFVFHISLLITPIFLSAHNIMLKQGIGISLPTIPDSLADVLTIALLVVALFFILRRIALAEVRIISKPYDYLLIVITAAPFLTGFISYHQICNSNFWIIAHIISGEIMLIAIPFTKLSHFILFFFSRAQIGMDFGIKRGGMKNKGLAW
jgi:nitrate reductase gamma subunit